MVPWLQSEIRRMRELGLVDARAMGSSKLIENMQAFSREAMTLGYLMVKPWYMLGNLLSVPEQLVMTQVVALLAQLNNVPPPIDYWQNGNA